MINPVDNRSSYTNVYERNGKKAERVDGNAPAFLLPDEENGVIWEREKKEDVPKRAVKEEKKTEAETKKKPVEADETSSGKKEGKGKSFSLSDFFGKISNFFKSMFSKLWYGEEASKESVKENEVRNEPLQEKDAGMADARGDEPGRIQAVSDTENGTETAENKEKKQPARNTELLTHYDRHGRIVSADNSDTGRILRHERRNGKNIEKRPQGNYRKYI